MNSKSLIIYIFIVVVILSGCTKEKFTGEYSLSDELIFLLPSESGCNYISSDSILNEMTHSFTDNYYFRDTWDTDDGGMGIIYYTGDFESYTKFYSSHLFDIKYEIFVDKGMDVQYEMLDITITSKNSIDFQEIRIEWPLLEDQEYKGYQSNIYFTDSVEVIGALLLDIYYVESDEFTFYLQEDKGLVAFEFEDNFWMLENPD